MSECACGRPMTCVTCLSATMWVSSNGQAGQQASSISCLTRQVSAAWRWGASKRPQEVLACKVSAGKRNSSRGQQRKLTEGISVVRGVPIDLRDPDFGEAVTVVGTVKGGLGKTEEEASRVGPPPLLVRRASWTP